MSTEKTKQMKKKFINFRGPKKLGHTRNAHIV